MIEKVDECTIAAAGYIHSEAWKASHGFCTPEFVAKHTPEAQAEYLRRELEQGKQLYMLSADRPVAIVSVWGSLIENLYVLPREQNRGFGTRLLKFAMALCGGDPTLWVLNTNERAKALYLRHGFRQTGRRRQLKGDLYEMELTAKHDPEAEKEMNL